MKETKLMQITSCSYSSCFSCFVFSYPSCHCGPTVVAVLVSTGSVKELMAFTNSARESMAFASSTEAMEPLVCHHFPFVACSTEPVPLPTFHLSLSS